MIKNYFKTAWRNIIRHKTHTFINILSLALGISGCIIVYIITSYEYSFDRFHPDGDRIYRITEDFKRAGGEREFLNSITPDMAGIQYEIPGFESKAGIHIYYGTIKIQEKNGAKKEFDTGNNVIVTWPDYFKIFKYQWLAGDESSALSKPYQIVLSESEAQKFFGTGSFNEIIGKTVVFNDSLNLSVSGIVKDWTENSDLVFKDFISISTVSDKFLEKTIPTDDWRSLQPHRSMVFVKLDEHTTAQKIDSQLGEYLKKHSKQSDFFGSVTDIKLQPLSSIHFTNEFQRTDDGDNFRKAYSPALYALMGLALFILLIAVFNFINLSTAQSIQRSKEIGVRKVLGSSRRWIVMQFLAETAVFSFFAGCIGVSLTEPILHLLSSYIPAGLTFSFFDYRNIIFLLVLMIMTSILAGIYPGIVLSRYLPVKSLRGTAVQGRTGKFNLRKGLIIFQFALSSIFIIGSIIISSQIGFMYNKNKGFNPDNVITIFNWGDNSGKMKVLMQKIKQIPGVDGAILEGTPPM